MKLSFENLGAIKKIDVDLSKKLTVFCGPNGTGKTYACYAIYGYLRLLLSGLPLFKLDDLLKQKTITIHLDYTELYKFRAGYFNYLNKHIKDVFGVKSVDFFNLFKTSDLFTVEEYSALLRSDEFEYNYNYEGVSINYIKKKNNDFLCINIEENIPLDKITESTEIFHLATITKLLCNRKLLYSYILPVERNSAYTFGNELAAKKINELNAESKEQNYPSPIKDTLSTVVELKSIKNIHSNSAYQSLATEIEQTILHGKVTVSDDGALQFISEKAPNVVLPVHLSASIVKNISGLLIYLKHQAKNNELLIIDEPEIGLHPDNQILLARIFAKLINNGIKLLISTHSDYIIRELNNLIMLSSEKEEIKAKATEFGYHSDEKIKPEDVGAYLFEYNVDSERYVSVKNLPVDANGFEVDTIDQAISTLNDRSMDLYFSLTNQDVEDAEND
jgi:predicted ATP-dependent endonuclease of OLD family